MPQNAAVYMKAADHKAPTVVCMRFIDLYLNGLLQSVIRRGLKEGGDLLRTELAQ